MFNENIEAISKESSKYICDYENSMEVAKDENGRDIEVSFSLSSHYTDNDHYVNISDWVWKRTDGKDKFSFDSEAEREWVDILKELSKDDNINGDRVAVRKMVGHKNPAAGTKNLFGDVEQEFIGEAKNVYMWGKNYVANSEIKFEYYLGALHSSYPDFVMKDSYGRIHIFEVKSVNVSSNMVGGFDNNIYKTKLEELKKAYKQASKLTNQIFYLPILRDDSWRIFRYMDGDERILTKEEFIDACKRP